MPAIPTISMLEQPVRLARQGTATQVANVIRQKILSGDVLEGTQLRQEQLAAEFGISKVPVREALHQLEAEGFVVQQFHRGAVVSGLSPDEIVQLFEVRAQIEVWLLGLAMAVATDQDIAAAEATAQEIATSTDDSQYPVLNQRFHEALSAPAGKPLALHYVSKLHTQIERYVRMQFKIITQKDQVISEHMALLNLYKARDPSAGKFLEKHILDAAHRLAAWLQERNVAQGAV